MPAQSFFGSRELRVPLPLQFFSLSTVFDLPSWETTGIRTSHEEARCPEYM